ncbi:MAG TPA: peptidase M64 N-terminal domain-containing protein, partial [Polyangiaceae bacterium]|nr:peptidase M64 N-terminal domain-containing protein [Polyangiaceae bacterium]
MMHSRRFRLLRSLCCCALLAGPGLASDAAAAPAPVSSGSAPAKPVYAEWFTDEAMRVDLFHAGSGSAEDYSLDEVVWEPLWPGTRVHLIDPFGFGTWRFRVVDAASSREIFRQGYATLFDEWQGTAEAQAGVSRSMSES